MNAPNPNLGDRESEALRRAQRAHEPSMEEILASIRAIIADDRKPDAAKPAAPQKPAPNPGPQIVYSKDTPIPPRAGAELETVVAKSRAAQPPSPTDNSPVVWRKPTVEVIAGRKTEPASTVQLEPEAELESESFEIEGSEPEPPLISEEADRAVSESFQALSTSFALRSSELLDGMTREMLRPMIKTWLDEHLPSLVERLVRAEIQRVARGGR